MPAVPEAVPAVPLAVEALSLEVDPELEAVPLVPEVPLDVPLVPLELLGVPLSHPTNAVAPIARAAAAKRLYRCIVHLGEKNTSRPARAATLRRTGGASLRLLQTRGPCVE